MIPARTWIPGNQYTLHISDLIVHHVTTDKSPQYVIPKSYILLCGLLNFSSPIANLLRPLALRVLGFPLAPPKPAPPSRLDFLGFSIGFGLDVVVAGSGRVACGVYGRFCGFFVGF